jgi:hypothetical protein
MYAFSDKKDQNIVNSAEQPAKVPPLKKSEIDLLVEASPELLVLPTGEIAEIFKVMSDYTDIQRSNKLKELKNKIVVWNLTVYNINKAGKKYVIQTEPKGIKQEEVSTIITLTPINENQISRIESLKTGDKIKIKGILTGGSTMRALEISPAIFHE